MKKIYSQVNRKWSLTIAVCFSFLFFNLPLIAQVIDALPPALGAYSIRKLRLAYAGSAMNVRRISDNAQADVAFDVTGKIDPTSVVTITVQGGSPFTVGTTMPFSTFYAGTDCNVAVWYDQSGNSNNATQASVGSQPNIVRAGVMNLTAAIPCIEYVPASQNFFNTGLNLDRTSVPNVTINTVYRATDLTTAAVLWGCDNGNFDRLQFLRGPFAIFDYGISDGTQILPQPGLNTLNNTIYTAILQNGVPNGSQVHVNGPNNPPFTETTGDASAPLVIGQSAQFGFFAPIRMQEFIVFPSALTVLPRRTLELNQGAFYGLAVLPVKFSSIKGYEKNAGIQVEWVTDIESNLDHFEVENSTNGVLFTTAGNVMPTTSKNYSWFDANPKDGNNMYRIKAVDKDGHATYSNVVKIVLSRESLAGIRIYPNPVVTNTFNLEFSNLKKGTYTVTISNNLGQPVIKRTIVHNGGSANQSFDLKSEMPKGIYQIQVAGSGNNYTTQLIKN